jgi:hypothetical protein
MGQMGQIKKDNKMNNDFNYQALANEIIRSNLNIAESYDDWTKLAFSLANLGENGRAMFNAISSLSEKYNEKANDKKFDEALRNNRKIGIASFIYMAQSAGVDTNRFFNADSSPIIYKVSKPVPQKPIKVGIIPKEYLKLDSQSSFIYFLCEYFSEEQMQYAVCAYNLGACHDTDSTETDGVIFPYIDYNFNYRAGKVMYYNTDGHRRHDRFNSVQSILKKKNLIDTDATYTECLFGEHLLRKFPNKMIAICESEKSAIIGSIIFPNYTWLATGGKAKTDLTKYEVLKGKNVILFPDADGYNDWCELGRQLSSICRVIVSDIIEKNATEQEKINKIDVADWLIKQLQLSRKEPISAPVVDDVPKGNKVIEPQQSEQETTLNKMIKKNPNLKLLVDKFNLVAV